MRFTCVQLLFLKAAFPHRKGSLTLVSMWIMRLLYPTFGQKQRGEGKKMGGEQVVRRQERETRNKFCTYFLSPTPPVNLVVLSGNKRICSELMFLAFCCGFCWGRKNLVVRPVAVGAWDLPYFLLPGAYSGGRGSAAPAAFPRISQIIACARMTVNFPLGKSFPLGKDFPSVKLTKPEQRPHQCGR